MNELTISCESCERSWTVASTFSVYEQQAIESRPCPHCGAYTLGCPDPTEARPETEHRPAARVWRSRRVAVRSA